MKITITFCFIFLMVLGCDDEILNPNLNGLKIMTTEKTYSVNLNQPIVTRISNKSDLSVFLPHCNFHIIPEVEKKESNSWIHYSAPICLAIYQSGILEFKVGQTSDHSMIINETGTFRLKIAYSFTNSDSLDKELYSEEFYLQ